MIAGVQRPAYRPDIDGLRALAVVSVVLAHAGAPFARGGYLGVDVFFVISGYLITLILTREIEGGGIRFAHFYERRARRILPALVLVLAISLPFAFWLMLPEWLENFGQEMFATLVFANNLKLALTMSYWDIAAPLNPLLHTWSLGVEEQFYLVFPLLLALAAVAGRRGPISAILAAGAVSFALAEISLRYWPGFNFYLPTSRAWELMAGAAAAYVPRRPRRFDQPLTLACLAAVILPMGLLGEQPTPSVWCLPTVFGTAGLLVFSREGTLAASALSWRPVVFLGLISYSAYLWHQPLFAFARISSLSPLPTWSMAGLVLLTFVLAALSWRFVEQPFRDPSVPFKRLILLVIAPAVLLAGLGLVLHFHQGFPHRVYPNIEARTDVSGAYTDRIRSLGDGPFPENGRANVLIAGNSMARDAANVLFESGALRGKNVRYVEEPGRCGMPQSAAARAALERADVVVVALQGMSGECAPAAYEAFQRLTQVPVVVFGSKHFGDNINPYRRVPMIERSRVLIDPGDEFVASNAAAAAALPADRFINLLAAFGPDGRRLRFFDDRGNPLTFDGTHLTRYGAIFAARRVRESGSVPLAVVENAVPRNARQ